MGGNGWENTKKAAPKGGRGNNHHYDNIANRLLSNARQEDKELKSYAFSKGEELSISIMHGEDDLLEELELWTVYHITELTGSFQYHDGFTDRDITKVDDEKLKQLEEYTELLKSIEEVKKGPAEEDESEAEDE